MGKKSAFRQFAISTNEYVQLLLADVKNLMISIAFPVLGIFLLLFIAGDNVFVTYEATRSAALIITCVALWGGLFNSVQCVVKDREVIHRNHTTAGLRLGAYIASRAIPQFVLCMVQSAICVLSYPLVCLKFDVSMPSEGVVIGSTIIEYYVTILLLTYAADMMGLMISSMVKKTETANVLSPYILIVQLIFSGILFKMEGLADSISKVILSRWGMEALGATSQLNDMELAIQQKIPQYVHEAEAMYEATAEHMFLAWGVLAGFIVLFLVASMLLLRSVKKDTR